MSNGSFVNFLQSVGSLYTQWVARQRVAGELGAMSDRELSDVGLVRSDIDSIMRGSFRQPEVVVEGVGVRTSVVTTFDKTRRAA